MSLRSIRGGVQPLRLVTAHRPTFVGIDAYTKYIDRNGDDNVVPVGS